MNKKILNCVPVQHKEVDNIGRIPSKLQAYSRFGISQYVYGISHLFSESE